MLDELGPRLSTSSPALAQHPPGVLHGHDLIAHYATLRLPVGSILGEFAKRLEARWVCADTLGDPRAFPSGVTGVNDCRYHNWMGVIPCEGARLGWPAHTEIPLPQKLHRKLERLRLSCWELGVNRPSTGQTAVNAHRVPLGCVPMERWKTSYMCLWSAQLTIAYGPSTGATLAFRDAACAPL